MNPCELTLSITALANSIACRLSDEDLVLAAAVATQLGDTLATISTQRIRCKTLCGEDAGSGTAAGAANSDI